MDIKACAAVREAVGPHIDLMIDGYHWYSRAEALWIGKELEKLNFAWFEEPMEEDSMSSLCRGWRKTCRFPSSGRRASAASTTCAPNG
ncbi:putative mandelate racemase / muconate lactonizing enzyme [Klebsiella pneumoniae]|uniref:Putative mandelate racemase / muconate lactonizing enzyme n=1 Tax=Klebsiella pneumoniae TaxID=573 RepID=A0A378C4T1_KLEPN|nr:putative mandelate racemase / muconate lactonizing enzyme [Klebsiella pneumoniae]